MDIAPFDFNKVSDFDAHIHNSIPGYDNLQDILVSLSGYYTANNGVIYDLGCSTGSLLKRLPYVNKKVGMDIASNMVDASNISTVEFLPTDLRDPFTLENACVVFSIFTMQFLPREVRHTYIANIYASLRTGGALFVCEKVYQESGRIHDMFTHATYDYKTKSFSDKEILDKERSIRSVMQCDVESAIVDRLESVGFTNIYKFWQNLNFCGYMAVK